MRWTLTSALALTVMTTAAAAQRPGAPDQPTRRSPAAAMAAAREQLGLSPDQVARLEALAATHAKAMPGNPGDGLRARADMLDALKGEGDAAALKRALDRMHQLRTERALVGLKFRQEARAILTAEQRAKADAWRESRRMGRGGGRGLMRGRGPAGAGQGWQNARPGRELSRPPVGQPPRGGPPADRQP